jgi:hypothetical protein
VVTVASNKFAPIPCGFIAAPYPLARYAIERSLTAFMDFEMCSYDRPHFVLTGPEGVVSALAAPLTMFHNLIGHAETPTWRSGPYESEGF